MIFNLFSNIAQSNRELETLQTSYWKKLKLSAPQIYNIEQTVIDPVAKLLEDIKNRNREVIVPTKREIISNLWNNKKFKKSLDVKVTPTKINWEIKPTAKLLGKQMSSTFPTAQQKTIMNKLQMIPAYSVITNTQEMVMLMSRETDYDNVLTWLYRKYSELFLWNEDKGPISIALFFLNREDAILYMQALGNKSDVKLLEKSRIHVKDTTLAHFYYLSKTFPVGQQAKIIADLEELEKVIFSHIPSKLQNPYIKQSYTNNGFTGTPIYTINATSRKKAYKQQNLEVTQNQIREYINSIFFKLEDAYLAWEKICETNKNAKLELRPNIEIYNLENYLSDLEKTPEKVINKLNFRPSFRSIRTRNKNVEKQINLIPEEDKSPGFGIKKYMMRSFRYEKLVSFYKGLFWLFTSDNLPTEDNAW
jgi:hypothetical protein